MRATKYHDPGLPSGTDIPNDTIMDRSPRRLDKSQEYGTKPKNSWTMKKKSSRDAELGPFLSRYLEQEHFLKLSNIYGWKEAVSSTRALPEKNGVSSPISMTLKTEPEKFEMLSFAWNDDEDVSQVTLTSASQVKRGNHRGGRAGIDGSRFSPMGIPRFSTPERTTQLPQRPQNSLLQSVLYRLHWNQISGGLCKEPLGILKRGHAAMPKYAIGIPIEASTLRMQFPQTTIAIAEKVVVEHPRRLFVACGQFAISSIHNFIGHNASRTSSFGEAVSTFQRWLHQVGHNHQRMKIGSLGSSNSYGDYSSCFRFRGAKGKHSIGGGENKNSDTATEGTKVEGKHGKGDHCPRSSTTSYGGKNKNDKRKGKSNDDDEEDNADDRHKRIRWDTDASSIRDTESHTMLLACPYYKKNRLQHEACIALQLKRVKDVKQHIRRNHSQPLYCHRCGTIFRSHSEQDEHISAITGCREKEFTTPEGVTEHQREQFAQRVGRTLSLAEQWYTVWDIVFPDIARPSSPFMNSATLEMCGEVVQYWEDHGRQVTEGYLSQLENGLPSSENDLSTLFVTVGRKVLERIMEKMSEATRNGNKGRLICREEEPGEQSPAGSSVDIRNSRQATRAIEEKENNVIEKTLEPQHGRVEEDNKHQRTAATECTQREIMEAPHRQYTPQTGEPEPSSLINSVDAPDVVSCQAFNQLRPRSEHQN